MRAKDEINLEVQTLENMKPRVLLFNRFGENNHAAIDAQIKVLSTDMSEKELYDEYGETEEEDYRPPEYVCNAALEAYDWKIGLTEELPSSDWQDLIVPA